MNDDGSVYFRGRPVGRRDARPRWIGRDSFYVEHGDWFVAACARAWSRWASGCSASTGSRQGSPGRRHEPRTIALVGDYSERYTAHRAIPMALELARDSPARTWPGNGSRRGPSARPRRDLAGYAAAWVVPASPYENTDGALGAIRWAREGGRPFLGTCGGFQHALIEIARERRGHPRRRPRRDKPGGASLVVTPLSCSHVEKDGRVHLRRAACSPAPTGATAQARATAATTGSTRLTGPPWRRRVCVHGLGRRGGDPGSASWAAIPSSPASSSSRSARAARRDAAAGPRLREGGRLARPVSQGSAGATAARRSTTTATPATTTALAA